MPDIFKLTPHAPVHGCGCYKAKPLSGLDFTSSPAIMGLAILGVAAVAWLALSGSSSHSFAAANRRRRRSRRNARAYYEDRPHTIWVFRVDPRDEGAYSKRPECFHWKSGRLLTSLFSVSQQSAEDRLRKIHNLKHPLELVEFR